MIKLKLLFIVLIVPFLGTAQAPGLGNEIQEAIGLMEEGDCINSLKLLIDLEDEAVLYGAPKEQFLILNAMGANYYKLSDYGEALKNYLLAYDIATASLKEEEEVIALNNMGILFYEEKKYDKALEYFTMAYEVAERMDNTKKLGLYSINLGLALNQLGQWEEAYRYLQGALELLVGYEELLIQCRYALAENSFLKGDYKNATVALNNLLPQLEESNNHEHYSAALFLLAKISRKENAPDKANRYALEALRSSIRVEPQIELHEFLSETYFQESEYIASRMHRDSVLVLKDSLYSLRSTNRFEAGQAKLEVRNYEHFLEENRIKLQARKQLILIISILGTLLSLTLLIIWRIQVDRLKKQRIIDQQNQRNHRMKLENELESKNRKLAAKELSISTNKEVFQEMINTLKEQPELAQRQEIRKQVRLLKQKISSDSGEDFLLHFEEANHGFIKSLTSLHPNLNSNDIRFLSYLFMNLSNKEIASLLNITPDACRKRKERIARKMGVSETSDLYNYLASIE